MLTRKKRENIIKTITKTTSEEEPPMKSILDPFSIMHWAKPT
jgi:hypothetical protein